MYCGHYSKLQATLNFACSLLLHVVSWMNNDLYFLFVPCFFIPSTFRSGGTGHWFFFPHPPLIVWSISKCDWVRCLICDKLQKNPQVFTDILIFTILGKGFYQAWSNTSHDWNWTVSTLMQGMFFAKYMYCDLEKVTWKLIAISVILKNPLFNRTICRSRSANS